MRPTQRRYIYADTADEIIAWAEDQIRKGLIDKGPRDRASFPYYLEQYIKNLKEMVGSHA